MNLLTNHRSLVLGLLASALGAGVALLACSSGSSSDGFTGNSPDGSTASGDGATSSGACTNPTLAIVFSPMYSAYIPGSSAQTFSIPAIMADGNQATWSVSDSSQANLQTQSFTNDGTSVPGVMITVAGTGTSGKITVYARESGGACGAAELDITTNTENDWTIGSARYNDGVSLHVGPPTGYDGGAHHYDGGFPAQDGGMMGPPHTSDGGSFFEEEGGTACTNCHGPTATNGPFKDVSHTPEQTGGFSDTDLQNIILNGQIPDGGYFDPTVLRPTCDGSAACTQEAYMEWSTFHRWTDITTDELPGVICYLRSLAPESQNGTSNFGGGHHHDGGGGPPPMMTGDAGSGGD